MKSWVIVFNSIDNGDRLMYEYETIQGKTAKDALKKRFNTEFKRVVGDSARYAEIILVPGRFDNDKNTIFYQGRYITYCYTRT